MRDHAAQVKLFEHDSIISAVLRLAIPTVISQIILVIYNMADTYFISLTDNTAMITAVTVCMPAFMFLSAISNLFGVGGASVISRSLGVRDISRAKHTAAFAFWGCALLRLVYSSGAGALMAAFVDALGGSAPGLH